MIEQHAIILAIETPVERPAVATIEVVRRTACGLCGKTRGCGNAFWGKLFGHKDVSLKAENTINAKVGQSVIVGIEEKALLKSALLLYIAPLATMLFGAILASKVSPSDLSAMVGAVAGLLVGFFWVKAHVAGRVYYQNYQPKILRLDNAAPDSETITFQ
ncbi:MAG: SoxR reducing system RseC family protein [Methylophilaceae bacterium]|nr:SoxR reducing system RseC family protein [Methylophilaceae bacterium]|tara:strand:+ start:357 stop:836 length:480 start_codon:yes stop_codon:yes gene_type:complete